MVFNNTVFSSTRHKIAFFFSVLSSVLLVSCTLIAIVLLRWEITRQAKTVLQQALASVQADYQADRLSSRVGNILQLSNLETREYSTTQRLPNINDKKTVSTKDTTKNINQAFPVVGNQQTSDDNSTVTTLEKNRQVYSRVIAQNGDILSTSDLFETYNIEPQPSGFFTFETTIYCFHVMTSQPDDKGSIIQVGQYCAFSFSQQLIIFLEMLVVTSGAVIATYFLGWIIAGHLLKPLEAAVKQTRQFAENCYHELMTPLTVAMSSVSAALKAKKYQAGLQSVDEDLQAVFYSLQTLSQNASYRQNQIIAEKINLSELLIKCVQKYETEAQVRHLNFDTILLQKNIVLKADKGSCQILMDNILSNALKYAQLDTTVTISLDQTALIVKNQVEKPNQIQPQHFFTRGYRGNNSVGIAGHGFGLPIVKELAAANGWRVSAGIKETEVALKVKFVH